MSLVSVILPTYNRAKFLARSISSVMNQTFASWELIVWDDGSTDNSVEVVASFNDLRIHYFQDQNHGAAFARNRAIERSTGKYLAFLDSDDEWVDEKLAIQVGILETHNQVDLLFSDFLNIHILQGKNNTSFKENSQVLRLLSTEQMDDNLFVIKSGLLESLAVENYIATDSVIIKKKIIEEVGLFNEGLRNSEDFELWWRFSLRGICFAYVDRVLLTRYKPTESLSSHSKAAYENQIRALDSCVKAAKTSGQNELISHLRSQYRNVWQNRIVFYGDRGDTKAMVNAFVQSLKYGFRLGSVRLLLEGLLKK